MSNRTEKAQNTAIATADQVFEGAVKFAQVLNKMRLPGDLVQNTCNSRRFGPQVRNIFLPQAPAEPPKILTVMDAAKEIGEVAEKYERLYRDYFGIEVDFSIVAVPDKRPGIETPLFIPRGLTCNHAYDVCAAAFTCWRYAKDLDAAVKGRNDRELVSDYMILTNGDQEPAEETGNISANRAVVLGVRATILLEELVAERFFWEEYKQNRNQKNVTLCHGSRDAHGFVPGVDSSGGRFHVCCYGPDDSGGYWRFRPAVSKS